MNHKFFLQIFKQNNAVIIIAVFGFTLSILSKLHTIPESSTLPFDYLTLGLSTFVMNLPRIILGIKIHHVYSLPFVGVAVSEFALSQFSFLTQLNGIIIVGFFIITVFLLKRSISQKNPGYEIKKQIEVLANELRKEDPQFNTFPKWSIFGGLWILEKMEIPRLFLLVRKVFPVLWGVVCLSFLLKFIDLVIPITLILSLFLIVITAIKILSSNRNQSKSLPSILRSTWDQEGEIEDNAKITSIKKIGSSSGALYFIVSLGGILYASFGLFQLANIPSLEIFNMISLEQNGLQSSVSSMLEIIGVVTFHLLVLSYAIILLTAKLKKTPIPNKHYLWMIIPAIIAFMNVNWNNSPQTVFGYLIGQFPTIVSSIIGLAGIGMISHVFISIKFKKTSELTRSTEKRIICTMIPFSIVFGVQISNLSTLISLAVFPLVWFSVIQFTQKPLMHNKTKRYHIIRISFFASFTGLGIIMFLSGQLYYFILCSIVSALSGILFLPSNKKIKSYIQKIFGITQIN